VSRWIAVIVGFVGVLVVVDPAGANWQWAAAVPLCAALAAALRDLATRAMAGVETAMSLLFFMGISTAMVSLATVPFGWTMPTPADLGLMVAFGLLTSVAMLIQVLAFRDAEAGLLAPFKYSSLIWSILLGLLFWGYLPSLQMLCGMAIVIGSGLFILQREIAQRRRRAPVRA
jgi:drug/metabolite transporter (DMT)-like permease